MDRLGFPRLQTGAAANCGGELQMVLIARALAAEPQVLILDEPESNLDFKNQLLVLDTMQSLARAGLTCVFNTHYPAHALRRANKALLLGRNGKSLLAARRTSSPNRTSRTISACAPSSVRSKRRTGRMQT